MHNSFYSDDYYDEHDALCHYGVKGMRWGVIRTPEQLGHKSASKVSDRHTKTQEAMTLADVPTVNRGKHAIGYSQEGARRIVALKDQENLDTIGKPLRKKEKLLDLLDATSGAATVLGMAGSAGGNPLPIMAAATVALPAKLAASIVKKGIAKDIKDRGLNLNDPERQEWYDEQHPYDNAKNLKKMSKTEDISEAMTKVNPQDAYEVMSDSGLRSMNCANCAMATIMRMKGYDVIARGNVDGVLPDHSAAIFGKKTPNKLSVKQSPGESTADYTQRGYDKLYKELSKQPKGSFGYMGVYWLNGGGHAFNYKIGDSGPEFFDGQNQMKDPYTRSYFALADPERYMYMRCDNLKPSPIITHYVTNREGDDPK